jgi:hypothetical protein
VIQDAHDQGHDVATATRMFVNQHPLGARPAQDLRYRLEEHLDIEIPDFDDVNPDRATTTTVDPATGPYDLSPIGHRTSATLANERHRSSMPISPVHRPGSRRR